MLKPYTLLLFALLLCQLGFAQHACQIKGTATLEDGSPASFAAIMLDGTAYGCHTSENGTFEINQVPAGTYNLKISLLGYQPLQQAISLKTGQPLQLVLQLKPDNKELSQVEVFGERHKQPEKLDAITRLPLKPSDQIQSISIISDRLIKDQGNLTITEATRNVPGVYNFATYGNKRESMSSRGFRGIPVLKNGVRVNSDFRGQGFITDMEGVESIQVMKGASAITQGVAGDIGGPGGIINIVTKTPKFEQGGYASLRVGSFGQVRPGFDVYGPLNEDKTIAFRINGALERADSYRKHVGLEKVYLNPSLQWRPDNRTTFTLEMDYLNDSRTPDLGTIALADDAENEIYDLPFSKFLGFKTDRTVTRNTTYAARLNRKLTDQFSVRAAYFRSDLNVSEVATSLTQGSGNTRLPGNMRRRSLAESKRVDKNSVVQFDLIGQDVQTGFLKHTFQIGTDLRTVNVEIPTFQSTVIDTINVFEAINNDLGKAPASKINATTTSSENSIGFMAQDVITVTSFAKVILGARYSTTESRSSATAALTRGHAINPLAGVIFTPLKGLNVFASYTNSTNPRTATRLDKDGNELGNEKIDQLEAGIKSDWFHNRLRFNLTFYKINNKNMNMQAVERDANGVLIQMPYYFKGGNDERKGIEAELTGRVTENLELIAGYALIRAQYKDHTTFVEGSSPLNTPDQTANLWVNYTLRHTQTTRFSVGAGAYYVGGRPNNDWTKAGVDYHEIAPNTRPWEMDPYTTVNVAVNYSFKHFGLRMLANNILDAKGYNAYRTSFINPIDPRNFATVLTYNF